MQITKSLGVSPIQSSTAVTPTSTAKDTPLLQLSPMPGDVFTIGDAVEGTIVFGRSGGGKSSGAGAAIARSFMIAGMGGIVVCASEDEAQNWCRYAEEAGRSGDLIRFDGSGEYRFNFLEYSMQRDNVPTDILASGAVDALQSVIETANRALGMSARSSGDAFWEKSTRLILTNAIDLLYSATGEIRLSQIMEFIVTAPRTMEQMQNETWQQGFFAKTCKAFFANGGAYPPDRAEAKRLRMFWLGSFPAMDNRTRSNIITTLETDLNPLMRGQMRKIFCTETNVVPEMTFDGKIILLDIPAVGDWRNNGVLAQMIVKYLWMRAVQRRKPNDDTRVVFNYADEGQLFLSNYDADFQALCRKKRCATVLLTQNLPGFYARIGGDTPEHTVNSLMGNLRNKIFHNNDCDTTNEFAAKIIGKESVWRASFDQNEGWNRGTNEGWNEGETEGFSDSDSVTDQVGVNSGSNRGSSSSTSEQGSSSGISYSTSSGDTIGSSTGMTTTNSGGTSHGTSGGTSAGISGGSSQGLREERDYAVEAHEFATQLKTGGPANGNIVTGVIVMSGRYFERNDKHWMQVAFEQ